MRLRRASCWWEALKASESKSQPDYTWKLLLYQHIPGIFEKNWDTWEQWRSWRERRWWWRWGAAAGFSSSLVHLWVWHHERHSSICRLRYRLGLLCSCWEWTDCSQSQTGKMIHLEKLSLFERKIKIFFSYKFPTG